MGPRESLSILTEQPSITVFTSSLCGVGTTAPTLRTEELRSQAGRGGVGENAYDLSSLLSSYESE